MTPRQMRLWHTPESRARLVARQALPVDVTEDHVAGAVLFLLGDEAAGITKQCIVVDGGLL
jgi:enoyl-[acyl-carrier-protein] reductase (NADH)